MNKVVTATQSALLAFLTCADLTGCGSDSLGRTNSNSCGQNALCSHATCLPDSLEELTLDQAREQGFSIDAPPSFLEGQEHKLDFHFGDVDSCTEEPSSDGQVRFRVQFTRLLLQKQKAAYAGGPACESYLVYEGLTELEAEGGLIRGTFKSQWSTGSDGIGTSAELDPELFEGSLAMRVDTRRAHEAKVYVSLNLHFNDPRGGVHTAVSYQDGKQPEQETGDTLVWPASLAIGYCDWVTDPSDTPLVTIDDYNARR